MDGGERPPAAWGPWKHTNTVINFYQGIMIFVGVVSNIATVWWTYRALRFFSRSGERICDELEKLYWYLVGHLFLWGIRSVQHRFQHYSKYLNSSGSPDLKGSPPRELLGSPSN